METNTNIVLTPVVSSMGPEDRAGGTVITRDEGPVRWVSLNRPERHNAIDLPTAQEWAVALAGAANDPAVRAVVLAGEGPSFSAGGDLKAFRAVEDRQGYLGTVATAIGEGVMSIAFMDKPVVAAVHGNAMGVGFSMFLAADYKLIAEGTRMAMSYVNVGLTPGGSGSWMLSRLVGHSKAMEMLLLGDAIGAEEAEELRIVNRVVSAPGLQETARSVAERFAKGPPGAIGRTKALIWQGYGEPLYVHLAREADEIGRAAATPEFEEGSLAFFEGREARF
ncbi:MAG: enoyl-CoA hydratase/isomerase family protein [Planctomycetes bacterium]|nr:enoyl-CoA hydratase/isomerase family protein [Planctomycetota bacterium]